MMTCWRCNLLCVTKILMFLQKRKSTVGGGDNGDRSESVSCGSCSEVPYTTGHSNVGKCVIVCVYL